MHKVTVGQIRSLESQPVVDNGSIPPASSDSSLDEELVTALQNNNDIEPISVDRVRRFLGLLPESNNCKPPEELVVKKLEFVESSWSPADMEQSEGRISRKDALTTKFEEAMDAYYKEWRIQTSTLQVKAMFHFFCVGITANIAPYSPTHTEAKNVVNISLNPFKN